MRRVSSRWWCWAVWGRIRGGRVLDYREKPERQMCRLFLSLMDKMKVRMPQFGDATRALDEV